MTIFQFSFGDGFAGSAKVALESSRLLKGKGYNIILFVTNNSLTEKRAKEYGINYINLDDKQNYKQLLKQIDHYFLKYKPEIIIGHHSLDRKTGISLKRKYPQVKNIAYRHNITKSFPIIGSFIYNRYTDYLIACSRGVEESLVKSGIKKNKVKTIYNGIHVPQNLHEISGNSIRNKFSLMNKTVLGLSTWFHKERKGFDILFNAFSGLNNSYILLLAGIPKEQQDEVIKYAEEFHISKEKLIMPGYVENIWEFYKAMDIFLLPSRSEGFSLALLEAAASSLPIIASDIPGNNEFIEDGKNGLLFNINSSELRVKIIALTKDKQLMNYLKRNAYQRVIDEFTLEKYVDNLDKFLKNI